MSLTIPEQADLALRLASEEPEHATEIAALALERATRAGLDAAESAARRALGLAARARDRIDEAIAHLEPAVEAAVRGGDLELAAAARASLASTLVFAGRAVQALAILDQIPSTSSHSVVAKSDAAGILAMLGRYEEALACYGPVVRACRRSHDQLSEARNLNNRGILYVYTGHFPQAEADFERAERLHARLGNLTAAAEVCHNRGFAAARRGDLPAALASLDQAERRYAEAGLPPSAIASDKAEVLLAAGLVDDARQVSTASVRGLRAGGNQLALAEGLVLLADIAFLAADHDQSAAAADEAAELFEAQGRPAWAAIAAAASARAALGSHRSLTAAAAEAASDAAETLDRSGMSGGAADAHLVAGRMWLALVADRPEARERAEAELRLAAAHRTRGPAATRLSGWYAEAIRRREAGEERNVQAALRAALGVVATQQATLGASELRAHVSVHARDVAAVGLGLALSSGRPALILEWMDRFRANSLRARPVRPPADEELVVQLAELRGVVSDVADEVASGGDARPLLRRQAQLERQIREHQWRASGHSPAGSTDRLPRLGPRLGNRALVELAEHEGEIHAVVVSGGRHHHQVIGPVGPITAELDQLRFALRRQAYGPALAGAGLDRAGGRLDELLLDPIRPLIGRRPLVLVPTGALHATPWAALPSLAGREVTVAPSARVWFERTALEADPTERTALDAGPTGQSVIAAGPGLEGAGAELAALGELYPDAVSLHGRRATARAVHAALEGAAVAHLAAHATFRADNGMWSSVQLADGPLTVYELETLRHPPAVVVLSACQSGLSTVRPGDEVLGLAAALLGLGTRAVIASVVPVADADTAPLMVALHRRLLTGAGPAAALAGAQQTVGGAAAASFACFGAG